MSLFSLCRVFCCICRSEMEWNERYGRTACTCSRECFQEFEWRNTLSIMGKPYEPDPRRSGEIVAKE